MGPKEKVRPIPQSVEIKDKKERAPRSPVKATPEGSGPAGRNLPSLAPVP